MTSEEAKKYLKKVLKIWDTGTVYEMETLCNEISKKLKEDKPEETGPAGNYSGKSDPFAPPYGGR